MQNYNQKTIRRKKYCYKKKLFQILTCHLIERSNNKCTTTNKFFFSVYCWCELQTINSMISLLTVQTKQKSKQAEHTDFWPYLHHVWKMIALVCLKTFWSLSHCPVLNTDIERNGSWKKRKRKNHMEQSPQWEHIVIKQFKNKFNTITDRSYYPAVSWRKARIQNHHLKYFAAKLRY